MTVREDNPRRALWPERVAYSNGMLLDDADLLAEQAYHRGRAAMLARYLHGHGTVAGLNVTIAEEAGAPLVIVAPGLAVDRVGRLIESPLQLCLRLDRWWEDRAREAPTELEQAFRAGEGGGPDHVLADVFIGFRDCEIAKRPAIASGAFDALGAVVPLRLREAVQATLVLRTEDAPPLPRDPLPTLAGARHSAARRADLDRHKREAAWVEDVWWGGLDGMLSRDVEHRAGQNPADLFLARITIPALAGSPPARDEGTAATAANADRIMSYSTADLVALGR